MKKFIAICLLFAASLTSRADLVMVQKMEGGGQTQDMTTKYKGDKFRVDIGKGMSVIMDLSSLNMVTLNHEQKMMMKVPSEQLKQMLEAAKKAQSSEAPKIVDSGKTEKVNGHDSKIYTIEKDGEKITLWMAKDFPNYAALQEQMKKMQEIQKKLGQDSGPDLSSIDGLAMKLVVEKGGQVLATITTASISDAAVADSDFTAPADYKDMAAMMGGAGAPPAAPAPESK